LGSPSALVKNYFWWLLPFPEELDSVNVAEILETNLYQFTGFTNRARTQA